MDRRFRRWVWILGSACLLSACVPATSTSGSPAQTVASASPQAAKPTSLPSTPVPRDATSGPSVDQAAIDDLAERMGLPSSSIQIMSIAPEEWPNPSLGCPKLGVLYAQIVVPGYRLVLNAAGRLYEYHTDQGTRAVTCTPPALSTPAAQTTAVRTIAPVGTYQPDGTGTHGATTPN